MGGGVGKKQHTRGNEAHLQLDDEQILAEVGGRKMLLASGRRSVQSIGEVFLKKTTREKQCQQTKEQQKRKKKEKKELTMALARRSRPSCMSVDFLKRRTEVRPARE